MRIDGLTESDVKLLDAMWAIDTTAELAAFIARQTPNVRSVLKYCVRWLFLLVLMKM